MFAPATSTHRFIGVWPIVVGGRVFARSWTLEKGGWKRAFACALKFSTRASLIHRFSAD